MTSMMPYSSAWMNPAANYASAYASAYGGSAYAYADAYSRTPWYSGGYSCESPWGRNDRYDWRQCYSWPPQYQEPSYPAPSEPAPSEPAPSEPAPSAPGGATATVVDDAPPPVPPAPAAPPPMAPPAVAAPVPPPQVPAPNVKRQVGRIYGDPHFKGFNGSTYNVQGRPNHIYNLVSDKGFQLNGRFAASKRRKGMTQISQAGIKVGQDNVVYNLKGAPTLDGRAIQAKHLYRLKQGSMSWDGKNLRVSSPEYGVKIDRSRQSMNYTVTTGAHGVTADGVAPHGLLGQTAAGAARHGKGQQGKGVIQGKVSDYQVSNILGTNDKHNRFKG